MDTPTPSETLQIAIRIDPKAWKLPDLEFIPLAKKEFVAAFNAMLAARAKKLALEPIIAPPS
jgi:hypothetical protein